MTSSEICIGIPTFKRQEGLRRVLDAVTPSACDFNATIIIGDNECSEETKSIVEEYKKKLDIVYIKVETRGISSNRNEIIEAAFKSCEKLKWLAMIDDDIIVQRDWLRQMIETAESISADAVGAPYNAPLSESSSIWMRNSRLVNRSRSVDGLTEPLTAAGNIILSAKFLRCSRRPIFLPEFGLSGGEDYEFFKYMQQVGSVFGWCGGGAAIEEQDPRRVSAVALIKRYYSTGNYMFHIEYNYNKDKFFRFYPFFAITSAVISMLKSIFLMRANVFVKSIFKISFAIGQISALLGVYTHRYR